MPAHLGALVNVAVFVPLGWLGYHAVRRRAWPSRGRILRVMLAAAALSLAVEIAQYVAANRHGLRWSFVTRHGVDVALNVLGAAVGALAAGGWNRRA